MPLRFNAAPMHNNSYNTRQYATVLFGDREDRRQGGVRRRVEGRTSIMDGSPSGIMVRS